MRDLPRLDGEVEEIEGRGLCPIPGLVDCHTHACFAGDRVEEFALRASGASYEDLHQREAESCPPSGRRVQPVPEELAAAVRSTAAGCCARGRRRSSRSPATASTATPSSRRSGDPRRGRDPHVARGTRSAARVRRRGCVPRVHPDAGPPGCRQARGSRGRVRRARRVRRRAGAALSECLRRSGSRAPSARATSSPSRAPFRSRSSSARGRSTTSRRRAPRESRRWEQAMSRRCCSRRARSSSPADAAGAGARRSRRDRRARDRLQSGQRILRKPAARCSLAATQLKLSPAEALAACTVNPAYILGRRSGSGAWLPATTPTSCCSTPLTGASRLPPRREPRDQVVLRG